MEAKEEVSKVQQHVAEEKLKDMHDECQESPEAQYHQLISRAVRAEQLVIEVVENFIKPSIVPYEEIHFTGSVLCKGTFGNTVIATYKGMTLAANVIQDVPGTAYNKMILYRELYKMFHVRHPNILQFIAASIHHGVVILSEYMPLSLQQELDKKVIPNQEILCILQDVASALMYLHERSPYPSIHYAVSPNNILLQPLALNWHAKLTNCFCSNYYYFCNNSPQLNLSVYTAPEMETDEALTPNSDVFSFGIVALEMVSQKLPFMTRTDQDMRLKELRWSKMANMIKKCIAVRPTERLNSTAVYEQLKMMPAK